MCFFVLIIAKAKKGNFVAWSACDDDEEAVSAAGSDDDCISISSEEGEIIDSYW